jgi:F0F1-type ATP synthase alpha subunit
VNRVQEFQSGFLQYVDASASQLRKSLMEKRELTGEIEGQLKEALNSFKSSVWRK